MTSLWPFVAWVIGCCHKLVIWENIPHREEKIFPVTVPVFILVCHLSLLPQKCLENWILRKLEQ